jgi:guanylate kinase
VGKGPLLAALKRLYPDLAARLDRIVLHNDRTPRPGEVDGVEYHFQTRDGILSFQGTDEFIVLEVRPGNFQALGKEEVHKACEGPGIPFLEAFYGFGEKVRERGWLKGDEMLSVFLSPLTKEEILFLKGQPRLLLHEFISEVMRRKLLRRTQKQKGLVSQNDLHDIEARVATAYRELKVAPGYDYVIPNHDGEDSENWDQFYYPIGDARKALLSFVDILEGDEPRFGEKWSPEMFT